MSSNFSRDEFLTFVLIYAAHGDKVVKESEIEYIKKRTSAELFERVFESFNSENHVQNFQVLVRHKEKFFPGKSGSQELLDEMEQVFVADGEYHDLEKKLFGSVRNIFSSITQ